MRICVGQGIKRLWTAEEERRMQEWRNEGVPLREIAERLGRTHKAVLKKCYEPGVPLCKERGRKLTEKELQWVVKHYKNTRNSDIMGRFGISHSELHRIARMHGLAKTRQFMRKTQTAAKQAAYESHVMNGTFPPKGYVIPGSEKARFKPGIGCKDRMTKRQMKAAWEKGRITWRKTYDRDRRRSLFGLEQETNFRFTRQPRGKILYRYGLRKCGYIEDSDDHNVYYYTSEEMRRPHREKGAGKYGIRILKLKGQ